MQLHLLVGAAARVAQIHRAASPEDLIQDASMQHIEHNA